MNPNFVPCLQEQYIGDINKNSDATDRGLRLFGNLINNRTFLLAFIRTLEAGKCNGTRNGWSVCVLVNRSLTGDEIVNKSVIPLWVQKFEEIPIDQIEITFNIPIVKIVSSTDEKIAV